MSKSTTLSCSCGATEWTIAPSSTSAHLMCYCKDCQAFARHLGAEVFLDDLGGTQIIQTAPRCLTFTKGAKHLGVLRLGPKGLLRWYTTCCETPVGNTLDRPNPSFVGAIVPRNAKGLGPIEAHVNTGSTGGAVAEVGRTKVIRRFMRRAFWAKITGFSKRTPFFDRSGAPTADPKVLTFEERRACTPD